MKILENQKNQKNVARKINLKIILISYCQSIIADLEKGLAHNIAR